MQKTKMPWRPELDRSSLRPSSIDYGIYLLARTIQSEEPATFLRTCSRSALDAARLRLDRTQLICLLQKADCLPCASQKLVIDTRPDRRHGPVRGSFNIVNIVARLDQNRIDPFEPGAFLQGPQTDFLKFRGRPDLAPYSFSGHCVSLSLPIRGFESRAKVKSGNPAPA
jgi:hypothetical protein